MSHLQHPDDSSEIDAGDLFQSHAAGGSGTSRHREASATPVADTSRDSRSVGAKALEREAPAVGRGWGRGPVPVDPRKFRYDVRRGQIRGANLTFNVTKADRMDAVQAGDYLHRIHEAYGLANEEEARILTFDKALFFEHTINGASLMQPGRGAIEVAGVSMDIKPIKDILGVDQRRFFRAFADDVAAVNVEVLDKYDPYDHASADKYNQLMQVAIERGLQKYPHLAHDSSDAGALSMEERMAVIASKARVIPSSVNTVDAPAARVGQAASVPSVNGGA